MFSVIVNDIFTHADLKENTKRHVCSANRYSKTVKINLNVLIRDVLVIQVGNLLSVFNNQFLMYCRAPGIFFHSRHLNKTTSECPSVSSYGSIIVKQTVTLSLIYYVQHCFPYCSKHLFKLNCVWYVCIYIYVYIYVFYILHVTL